jgi:hypothetical protein
MSYSKPEIALVVPACETIQGQKVGNEADNINRLSPYEGDE